MNQKDKISYKFSDAYVLAMVEGRDTQDVITEFSKDFPEMTSEFIASAGSLDLLYGSIRNEEKPSEKEIAEAYKRFTVNTAPVKLVSETPAEQGLFAKLKNLLSTNPSWAGASFGISVAVVIAILWQPWVIRESLQETAKNEQENVQTTVQNQNFASNDAPSTDLTKMPEVQYRGGATATLSAAQKRREDSIDAVRLKMIAAPKLLAAANNIIVDSMAHGSIMIRWSPVEGALSYIIEIKKENEDNFQPVTQISQTAMKLTQLESGKKYSVRIVAASGERKGSPSDAKSIVVP
jgi:hypothetical protein